MAGAGIVGPDAAASWEEEADVAAGSLGGPPASASISGSPMSADTVRGMPRRLASSHKMARPKATSCCVDSDGTWRRSMRRSS